MQAIGLLLCSLIILYLAYRTYGVFVSKRLRVDNRRETPAHTRRDGIDFEPAARPVVLGHHFASIAGAGPIVGPVLAVSFGWLPAFLWILVGSIFIGATHDFTSLVASLRHDGGSIGELIERYVGISGKNLFVVFALATLILVIAVFADVVQKTFIHSPEVASSSVFFIGVAIVFGVVLRTLRLPLVPATIAGVGLLVAAIILGYEFPLSMSDLSIAGMVIPASTLWIMGILAYVFAAAVTPVWMLLQPRDYLNSFLLYAMMGGAIVGLFFAAPPVEAAPFTGFYNESLGPIFPILFITVACGAISGFHSLVASGTTSKQLASESDAQFVGYGAMLIEAVLAIIALLAASQFSSGAYQQVLAEQGPIELFANGVGGFMAAIGIPKASATTFVALTVSAFALTTLDTCARLARFLLQELFEADTSSADRAIIPATINSNRFVATAVVVVLGGGLTFSGQFAQVWPVFGAANQLLAALALLAVATWLAHRNTNNLFVVIPMFIMYLVTVGSLGWLMYQNIGSSNWVLAGVSAILLLLSLELLRQAFAVLKPHSSVQSAAE